MSATLPRLVRQMRRLVNPDANAGDSALLALWIDHADQNAFELLVWRHGPMAWDTCRRILRHDQDAEDAFQATFLALARKASSIRLTSSLAGWLYRVAYRAALAARSRPNRIETRSDLDTMTLPRSNASEWAGCLDEELGRLPERYREPFILCCVEGLTTDEAAGALGCPRGTVATRVAWARRKLRERLDRQLPAVLPLGCVPASLVESVLPIIGGANVAPPVAELFHQVMTMLFANKIKIALAWLAPVLVVVAGLGGLSAIGTSAAKPADDKKPADGKKSSDKKAADIQGIVKKISEDGKTLTVATLTTMKGEEPKTIELKLTDRTAVRFSSVGLGETTAKEGNRVIAWLADNSKDTAAHVVFQGDKSTKEPAPFFVGPISSVANDGQWIVILVPGKKGEPDVEKTIKINDKTIQEFHLVGAGEAKLTKDLKVSVWLAANSEDTAARVFHSGKAQLPTSTKQGGEAPAYRGLISAVAGDGMSFTIDIPGVKKKGEEPKVEKVELKLSKDSNQVFMAAGPGQAKVAGGQMASIWVNPTAKDTVAVGVFQAKKQGQQVELAGKVVAVADDGTSFTFLIPPTKNKAGDAVAAGKEMKVTLADTAKVIFVNVAPGGAKITKDYAVRAFLAEGSMEKAATLVFSAE